MTDSMRKRIRHEVTGLLKAASTNVGAMYSPLKG